MSKRFTTVIVWINIVAAIINVGILIYDKGICS